ncbi:uncharacterized protein LOC9652003 [Selaginella moellendorffii]|uniref:uncharacterized protein LOC9652003 n=1 Tax=Selaginella moellendorffii TaxID=88036 RepID=UPI000D1CA7D0|nr:uncharacterized protein LOC9652003 [Selaginella moellendorffii]|eukprot:XP_024517536.1 uncharacterized protein LOC9652003 [Selaginella moellendorffii]
MATAALSNHPVLGIRRSSLYSSSLAECEAIRQTKLVPRRKLRIAAVASEKTIDSECDKYIIKQGGQLIIFFNPDASSLKPNDVYGVAFNALSLEFSFTNGKDWDGPYKLNVAVPPKFRNKPSSFFSEGWKCDLDLNPGCTDKENPFYDPLATVDDGTCPYVEEQVENEN